MHFLVELIGFNDSKLELTFEYLPSYLTLDQLRVSIAVSHDEERRSYSLANQTDPRPMQPSTTTASAIFLRENLDFLVGSFKSIIATLTHFHILHRDLTERNVMVLVEENRIVDLKLIDWESHVDLQSASDSKAEQKYDYRINLPDVSEKPDLTNDVYSFSFILREWHRQGNICQAFDQHYKYNEYLAKLITITSSLNPLVRNLFFSMDMDMDAVHSLELAGNPLNPRTLDALDALDTLDTLDTLEDMGDHVRDSRNRHNRVNSREIDENDREVNFSFISIPFNHKLYYMYPKSRKHIFYPYSSTTQFRHGQQFWVEVKVCLKSNNVHHNTVIEDQEDEHPRLAFNHKTLHCSGSSIFNSGSEKLSSKGTAIERDDLECEPLYYNSSPYNNQTNQNTTINSTSDLFDKVSPNMDPLAFVSSSVSVSASDHCIYGRLKGSVKCNEEMKLQIKRVNYPDHCPHFNNSVKDNTNAKVNPNQNFINADTNSPGFVTRYLFVMKCKSIHELQELFHGNLQKESPNSKKPDYIVCNYETLNNYININTKHNGCEQNFNVNATTPIPETNQYLIQSKSTTPEMYIEEVISLVNEQYNKDLADVSCYKVVVYVVQSN